MEVHMLIQAGAESVDESNCADVQGGLVHIRRTGAVGLQALRNDAHTKMRCTMLRTAPSHCRKKRRRLGTDSTHRHRIKDREQVLSDQANYRGAWVKP